jgi:hypothetical protein
MPDRQARTISMKWWPSPEEHRRSAASSSNIARTGRGRQCARTRPQLAAVIGWSVRSSNLRDRLGELRRGGFITTEGEAVKLTGAGAEGAQPPDLTRTVVDSVREILSAPQLPVFDAIPPAGRAIHRNDLCEASAGRRHRAISVTGSATCAALA